MTVYHKTRKRAEKHGGHIDSCHLDVGVKRKFTWGGRIKRKKSRYKTRGGVGELSRPSYKLSLSPIVSVLSASRPTSAPTIYKDECQPPLVSLFSKEIRWTVVCVKFLVKEWGKGKGILIL